MRLFHKDLIDVLPRQQLLGQWRELNSIFKKQDNHILINFVYDYPKEDLFAYTNLIIEEFNKRGYKIKSTDNMYNYFKDINVSYAAFIQHNKSIFKDKMNDIYLRQCLYNLEEKAMCGGITKEEWKRIYDKFEDKFNLWRGE